MENKNLPPLTPMESYQAPKVPTLEEVYKNPEPLKKLPGRWAKNAAVVTCVGILGVSTLAGCLPSPPVGGQQYGNGNGETETTGGGENGNGNGYGSGYNGYEQFDLVIRLHGGGAGGVGYVVHLTEQEALGIIRAQLEAAGLRFGATPPGYIAFDDDTWLPRIGLDLYDSANNVAVAHLSWENSNVPFSWWGREGAEQVAQAFAEQTDMPVGVFYTPGFFPGWDAMGDWFEDEDGEWVHIPPEDPTEEQREQALTEARPLLEERVAEQVEEFINFLREQGIVQ